MNTGEKTIRAFVCVAPPEEIVAGMEKFLSGLRTLAPQGGYKWVGREQLHLTLRFLGEAPEPRVAAMDRALRSMKAPGPFEIEIAGAGGFPNLNRPRALWMGVSKGGDALARLASLVEDAAVDAGYERETRKFKAHLTLARAREEGPISEKLREALADAAKLPTFSWRCENFILMRSELTRSGPIYTRLGEYGLKV